MIHPHCARIAGSFAWGTAEKLQEVYFINSSSTKLQEWSLICEPRRLGREDIRKNHWREWKRVKHEYCEGSGYGAEEICCRFSSWGWGRQSFWLSREYFEFVEPFTPCISSFSSVGWVFLISPRLVCVVILFDLNSWLQRRQFNSSPQSPSWTKARSCCLNLIPGWSGPSWTVLLSAFGWMSPTLSLWDKTNSCRGGSDPWGLQRDFPRPRWNHWVNPWGILGLLRPCLTTGPSLSPSCSLFGTGRTGSAARSNLL